jgi:hypothetical protein
LILDFLMKFIDNVDSSLMNEQTNRVVLDKESSILGNKLLALVKQQYTTIKNSKEKPWISVKVSEEEEENKENGGLKTHILWGALKCIQRLEMSEKASKETAKLLTRLLNLLTAETYKFLDGHKNDESEYISMEVVHLISTCLTGLTSTWVSLNNSDELVKGYSDLKKLIQYLGTHLNILHAVHFTLKFIK